MDNNTKIQNGNQTEHKSFKTLLDAEGYLKKLGADLAKIDHVLSAVLAKRMEIAISVQEWKKLHGNAPIIRKEIEDKRIAQFAEWAKLKGMDQNFAKAVLYLIIAESCRVQIGKLQSKSEALYDEDKEKWHHLLKENLLTLTAQVAPEYDRMYGDNAPFATKSYLGFEDDIVKDKINTLKAIDNTEIAIDIGCATGRMAFQLSPHFKKVIGYDISPEMIKIAKEKSVAGGITNTEFTETDIENGIPLEDNSISLAVMNLGTASDIRNIRRVIMAIKRVLKKDGRFVLSFYNAGALFYHYFIPWSLSLTAEINIVKHFLIVHNNEKAFSIFARPFTTREVKNLIEKEGLSISSILTHPTIASILPDGFFVEDRLKEAITMIDKKIANSEDGAYILAAGRKVSS